jgi:chaperone required for assembly of F1-ATPase
VRTPLRNPFSVPSAALAEAVAADWDAQDPEIETASMPLMQVATTAIDRIGTDPVLAVDTLAAYAETDLLCYRADEPQSLQERQRAVWQPLLDWAALHFDAPLAVTAGVMPVNQPARSLQVYRKTLSALDRFELAGVSVLTSASGSLILSLAVAEARLDAEGCIEASQLDEQFQIENWGDDPELAARLERVAGDIRAAARFLALLKS